jgi:hypothetical protein
MASSAAARRALSTQTRVRIAGRNTQGAHERVERGSQVAAPRLNNAETVRAITLSLHTGFSGALGIVAVMATTRGECSSATRIARRFSLGAVKRRRTPWA